MPTPLSLEDQIVQALRRITRAIDLRSRALMQRHGLTAPQLGALRAIGQLEPVPAGEVARALHLGQPTVTGILNRLERQGLIGRARGQRDRRHVEVRLTPEGRRVLDSAPSLLEAAFQRRLSELKQWQQTQILATLQQLADMMDAGDWEEAGELNLPPALDLQESGELKAESGEPEEVESRGPRAESQAALSRVARRDSAAGSPLSAFRS